MLRDKNLVPLSHQHQHALALCVVINRALDRTAPDLHHLQSEIESAWEQEISLHFEAEELHLFPAASEAGLETIVSDLLADHAALRSQAEAARRRTMRPEHLREFAARLTAHIRKEERQLFEECQARMDPATIASIGSALETYFATHAAGRACQIRQPE